MGQFHVILSCEAETETAAEKVYQGDKKEERMAIVN
jgi:hypothetical protein